MTWHPSEQLGTIFDTRLETRRRRSCGSFRSLCFGSVREDFAEKEMHFKTLVLLRRIVLTCSELTRNAFVTRFNGDTLDAHMANMELYLRLAMVQNMTPKSQPHRDWEWNLFDSEQLIAPIPGFTDAFDFYNAYDQELAWNPNYIYG
ncbi:hypothetical protein B0H14DRAFT_2638541 [Mycena olivaceomarginata]|nr:hypothetical protein B0H14DRAFT_2638541 [Mycena olivaceomarginata]